MIVHHLPRKIMIVVAFTLAAVGLYLFLLTKTGAHPPWQKRASAYIVLPDAYELVPEGDVREAGVLVGNVSSVNYVLTPGGVVSRVGLSLDPGYHVYRNARFQLRTKTLANENYVALTPGTPSAGVVPQGGTIPISHSVAAVQLDQVLDTFTPATRAAMQQEIDAVGQGLAGEGENLNGLLGAAGVVGQRGEQVLGILNAQRQQVADVVRNTSSVLDAFADRTADLRTLSAQARLAAEAAAARDAELISTLRTLPSALAQIRRTVGHLGSFSLTSTPVVDNLTSVTAQATPILADLQPTALATRRLVDRLPAALQVGRPLLAQLTPFANRLSPAVGSLGSLLRQADPALSYLSPYDKELGAFFADNGGAIGEKDAAGYLGRVFPIFSNSSLTGMTPAEKAALEQLAAIGQVQIVPTESTNGYPKPGTNGHPQAASGSYPHLNALPPIATSGSSR